MIMSSGPITSWPIDAEKVETVTDFILGGSKNQCGSNCSHELKDSCSLEENLWQTFSVSRSVVAASLRPHGLQPTRLLCPWDFPGQDTGVGCYFLLQGIFPTQGSNLGLLHCSRLFYWLSYKGSLQVTNLDSIIKRRDITMPTKVHKVKTTVFLAVMYRYENWTIKKADHWRTDAFKLWCWRKLFRVPWIATRSNQSILKGNNPEYSLKGLMLKLRLQYFGHLMWRAKLIGKDSDAGKDWGHEEKGVTEVRCLDGITDSMDMSLSNFWETVKDREAFHPAVHGVTKSWTRLSDWATRRKR